MPASPGRDLLLLGALMLAGLLLGNVSGNAGAGLAGGVLVYLLISYRRMAKLQHWLADGPLERDPPVQGGMLGDVADRMQHTHARLQKQLEEADAAVLRLRESYAALKDGIVMLGPDNTIEWSNASALTLLGLRYPQDAGQPLGNLVRDPDFTAYLAASDFEHSFELEIGGSAARTLEVQATSFGANRKVIFIRMSPSTNTADEDFLRRAIALSMANAKGSAGGPFGAVVVKDGKVVVKASAK